jgi:hypothetical protein
VVVDSVAVTDSGFAAEIGDRSIKPFGGGFPEAETNISHQLLSAVASSEQSVTHGPGGHDATLDGPPPLLAGAVLEADLIDT